MEWFKSNLVHKYIPPCIVKLKKIRMCLHIYWASHRPCLLRKPHLGIESGCLEKIMYNILPRKNITYWPPSSIRTLQLKSFTPSWAFIYPKSDIILLSMDGKLSTFKSLRSQKELGWGLVWPGYFCVFTLTCRVFYLYFGVYMSTAYQEHLALL